MYSKLLAKLAVIALGGLLVVHYIAAKTTHTDSAERRRTRLPSDTADQLPSARTLRSLFLNVGTMAADIAWIWSIVYYGQHTDGTAQPEYLEHSAETIAELDPKFYDVYPWFSAAYIHASYPPTFEDLERVNGFLEKGMRHYPTDYRLPYEAGLNYIGYSEHRTDEERIRELSRGIEYLQRASRLESAPDRLPLTVSWMYQRRRQIRSNDGNTGDRDSTRLVSRKQIEFLAEMYYLIDDTGVRRSIQRTLSDSEYGSTLLARYDHRYRQRLERERAQTFSFLPRATWSQVISSSR